MFAPHPAAARIVTSTSLALALILVAAMAAPAQRIEEAGLRVSADTSIVQEVELAGGTKLVGRIVEIRNGMVTFRTLEAIDVTFRVTQVYRIRRLEGARHGNEFWPRDPSDSRLFFAPTARVVGEGRGYAGLYELFFPSAAVGVGDFAMVSGGMSLFPGLSLSDQFYYITPKLRIAGNESIGAAAGALWFAIGSSDESGGLVYSAITAGNEIGAITAGPAFPFASGGGFTDEFLGMLGGQIRITPSVKFISENWFVSSGEGAFFTFGVRLLERRHTIEAAALIPSDGEIVLPVASFSTSW